LEVVVFRRVGSIAIGCLMFAGAAVWPRDVAAQGWHGHVGFAVSFGPYYPYYAPFYGWYGWYPYAGYWRPYPYYPSPYYPYYYGYGPDSGAKIQATPKDAEVYVDGYLVGLVDDFDGWGQRLNAGPGEHEIQVYREGFRTVHERVMFTPGHTMKLQFKMEPLAPGTPPEPRPAPQPRANTATASQTYTPRRDQREGSRPVPPGTITVQPGDTGAVALRVQPFDAEVVIDGERWNTAAGEDRLVVQLADGEHRLEIHKDGYRTYATTIRIHRGETTPLNVSLSRQ
jgi:hypothetical protein